MRSRVLRVSGRSAGRRLLGSGSIRPLPDIPQGTPWQERPPAETEGMAMEKTIYQEIAARPVETFMWGAGPVGKPPSSNG